MKILVIIIFIFACFHTQVYAQLFHFSQFYATPLWNNPAFTGYTDGPYRVSTSFRSQAMQGGDPYLTSSLSADVSPLKSKLKEGNKLGVGMAIMNDQSLAGALKSNIAALSLAYHLSLDQENIHHIGVGFQGTYSQQRIDVSKLTFENQYDLNGFNAARPVAEMFTSNKKNHFDINTGLVYNYSYEGSSFFISASAANILQKQSQTFIQDFKNPVRYSFMGSGQHEVGAGGVLYLSVINLRQGKTNETNIGGAYGLQLGTEQVQLLNFGLWHRLKDAIIPYVGYQLNGMQFGFSYDRTISPLKTAANTRNAFEFSIIYQGIDRTEMKKLVPWY